MLLGSDLSYFEEEKMRNIRIYLRISLNRHTLKNRYYSTTNLVLTTTTTIAGYPSTN